MICFTDYLYIRTITHHHEFIPVPAPSPPAEVHYIRVEAGPPVVRRSGQQEATPGGDAGGETPPGSVQE